MELAVTKAKVRQVSGFRCLALLVFSALSLDFRVVFYLLPLRLRV